MVNGKVKRLNFRDSSLSQVYYGQKGSVFIILRARRPRGSVSVVSQATSGVEPVYPQWFTSSR